MMAGGVTNQYMDKFFKRSAKNYGYKLEHIKKLNGAPGPSSLHKLMAANIDLPVFFCGISPSANDPKWLVKRVEENRDKLLNHL